MLTHAVLEWSSNLCSTSSADVHAVHECSGNPSDSDSIGDTSQIDSDARVFLLTARVGCIGEKASRRIVFVRK